MFMQYYVFVSVRSFYDALSMVSAGPFFSSHFRPLCQGANSPGFLSRGLSIKLLIRLICPGKNPGSVFVCHYYIIYHLKLNS